MATQGTQGHSAGPADVSGPSAHQAAAGVSRLVVTDQLAPPMAKVANQQSSGIFWRTRTRSAWRGRGPRSQAGRAGRDESRREESRRGAVPGGHPDPGRGAAEPAATATVPAASGSPQQIAEAMLGSFGWSSSQFSCLDPLWAHESGWSVSAYNAGSGAFGIPQALPGSRMASAGPDWQTDAATQIRWGLEYIKGTYGSPCGAWAHEEATGWY